MGKFLDLTGKRFGYLEVLHRNGVDPNNGNIMWKCKCICGNIKTMSSQSLKKSKTCGCKYEDLSGVKSGILTAVKFSENKNRQNYWLCKCECGNEIEVPATKLRTKRILSCGCKSGRYSHGLRNTKIYNIWNAMKQRCLNENFKDYHSYGGRGISVCYEWLIFDNFYKDMGSEYVSHIEKYGVKNTTLDRIDVNGNYCKDNCRWATVEEQSFNKRDTIRLEYDGKIMTLKEISIKYNLPLTTLYCRYEKGQRGYDLIRPYRTKL